MKKTVVVMQARFFCNAMPWVDCTALRYHCTKIPDVDLCPEAYAEGRFPPGCTAKDFIRIDAAKPPVRMCPRDDPALFLQNHPCCRCILGRGYLLISQERSGLCYGRCFSNKHQQCLRRFSIHFLLHMKSLCRKGFVRMLFAAV